MRKVFTKGISVC